MLEDGLEWRRDFTVQELMQETENDLIFQKYKKISTQLFSARKGVPKALKSSARQSPCPFRRISTYANLSSGHKAGIKHSQRGLKAVLVF